MRHSCLWIIMLSCISILSASCTKDLKESKTAELHSDLKYDHTGNSVRLTYGESIFGGFFYEYNDNGLVDRIHSGPGFTYFAHEYDAAGKLVRAQLYPNTVFNLYIDFFYTGKEVTYEVWYLNGNLIGEHWYHYNAKGQMYFADNGPSSQYYYTYTTDGNIDQFTIVEEGKKAFTMRFTYGKQIKNPLSAVPGFSYNYNASHGFYVRNKWHPTSEIFVFYDEEGNEITFQEVDPESSIIVAGPSNYATSSDYFDILNNFTVHYEFRYGNCGSCADKRPVSNNPAGIDLSSLLSVRSDKTVKQRANEIRMQLKAKGLIK